MADREGPADPSARARRVRRERICAIATRSAKHAAGGVVAAVFVDRIADFAPSRLESMDSSRRLSQRIP
jgi:hypothetical protein